MPPCSRAVTGLATVLFLGTSCLAKPNQFEPSDPAEQRGQDGAAGRYSDGSVGGAAGEGGTSGTGNPGPSGTGLDADRPIDADQPAGGCGTPGRTCVDNVLRICESSGNFSNTMCANGCDPTRLECNVCKPNGRVCEGANQVVCSEDGLQSTSTPCKSGCQPATGECNDCEPSAVWCNGDVLRECTAAGEQKDRQSCEVGCNSMRLACNACRPGTKVCNGNVLEVCKPDGTGTSTETCNPSCNTARLACNVCQPEVKKCSGSTLQTCRTDGSGWVDLNCPNGCMAERCNVCNPSQGRTCDGSSVKECMSDGSGFRLTFCNRGCASGACCSGNTEARGGGCVACGGNNQSCCEVVSPICSGSLACESNRCVIPCGAPDGQCPSGCNFSQDRDCKRPNGEGCGGPGECQSGNCAGNVCCNNGQNGCGGRCFGNNDRAACGSSCTRCTADEVCRSGRCELDCGSEGKRCCPGCDNDNLYCDGGNFCRAKIATGRVCDRGPSSCRSGRCEVPPRICTNIDSPTRELFECNEETEIYCREGACPPPGPPVCS